MPQLRRPGAVLLFEALAVVTTSSSISSSPPGSSAWALQCLFPLQSQQGFRWWLAWSQTKVGLSLSQVP